MCAFESVAFQQIVLVDPKPPQLLSLMNPIHCYPPLSWKTKLKLQPLSLIAARLKSRLRLDLVGVDRDRLDQMQLLLGSGRG